MARSRRDKITGGVKERQVTSMQRDGVVCSHSRVLERHSTWILFTKDMKGGVWFLLLLFLFFFTLTRLDRTEYVHRYLHGKKICQFERTGRAEKNKQRVVSSVCTVRNSWILHRRPCLELLCRLVEAAVVIWSCWNHLSEQLLSVFYKAPMYRLKRA